MFEGYIFYAIVAFTVLVITLLGVMGVSSGRRAWLVASFLVFLPVTYFASVDLMSRPKPVVLMMEFQRPNPEKAKVLSVFMKEDEYIMLLLIWDGLEYPRYFRWEWDQEMAEQLNDAQNQAKGDDEGQEGDIEMQLPFSNSLERRRFPWAHAVPQFMTMPPKKEQAPNVFNYNRDV